MLSSLMVASGILMAAGAVHAAGAFPPVPKVILGVNQYSIGPPELQAKNWPLTDADLAFLKSLGCNTVRFPVWPAEVGLDETKLAVWKRSDPAFSLSEADRWPVDWRSLDAVLDQLSRMGMTPYVSPAPEWIADWKTKTWNTLHVPEDAERALWFTMLVAKHVHQRYGGGFILGWYENFNWASFRHVLSDRFPHEWRAMLRRMYGGSIGKLNEAWRTGCASFDEVAMPVLLGEGPQAPVPEEAYNSRRTYEFRLAVDLMQRERLQGFREELRRAAPGAVWAGGCLLGELGGMNDTMSFRPPKTNGTMETYARTSDLLALDMYGPKFAYDVYYRTAAKLAAFHGKRYMVAEVPGIHPEAFGWIRGVGGPLGGVLVWAGKEDTYGLIKFDGTRREESLKAFAEMCRALQSDRSSVRYRPGKVHVYFPRETWDYSITRMNHVDAYMHVCGKLPPPDLEPVLTEELGKLPSRVPVFVIEKTLPRAAIDLLNRRGKQVVCPHPYFIDEDGRRVERSHVPKDFYAQLRTARHGDRLLEAFMRVEDKERNVAYLHLGGQVSSPTELAAKNVVLSDRPNQITHLIDGNVWNGVTFADKRQPELADVTLPKQTRVYGAFVDLFAGDGQMVAQSRTPDYVRVSVSTDGQSFTEVWRSTRAVPLRVHIRFRPVGARHVRFDFGENPDAAGLRLVELGVLGEE